MPRLIAVAVLLAAPAAAAQGTLSPPERTAAFKAAGFVQRAGAWRTDCDEPGGGIYEPGAIETVRDLNGDGPPEAVVTEGSTFCYGMTGTGFVLVSRQKAGGWRRMLATQGIATFLPTKGVAGWPDIEVGGPGFCFPVLRWNGREYVKHRMQYEGKPCRRP